MTRNDEPRATPRDRVLAAVDDDALNWRYAGSTTRYRLWVTETEYRTLTPSERKALRTMYAEGVLEKFQGWRHGLGGVRRVGSGR